MSNHPNDSMTRRQLLIAATAGAVGVAATAYGLTQTSDEARAQFEKELSKLRSLLALYEQLDKIGLDNIVASGIAMMRGLFDALKTAIGLMRDGITAAENAWKNFQKTLLLLRSTADRIAQMINELQQKFKVVEGLVVAVIGVALPLADSISGFFNSLLSKIPFVGEDIKRTANSLVELVRAIPALIEAVTAQLLKQVNDLFFQPAGKANIDQTLMDPITANLLDPLKKFLGDLDTLVTKWEKDFVFPVQSALDERKAVRKQIAEYRTQFTV